MKATAALNSRRSTTGVIVGVTGEIYTAAEFRRRAGLNDFSWRAARKAGLRVVPVGRKLYVRGIDWAEFLQKIVDGEIVLDSS